MSPHLRAPHGSLLVLEARATYGDLDLYVCNTEAPNLMYVNDGTGVFSERGRELGLDVVAASEMAAFADYDRDGDVDVYLLTNRVFSGQPAARDPGGRDAARRHRARPSTRWRRSMPGMKKIDGDWQIPESHRDSRDQGRRPRCTSGARATASCATTMARFVDASDGGEASPTRAWACPRPGGTTTTTAGPICTSPTISSPPTSSTTTTATAPSRDVTLTALPRLAYYGMGSDAADIDNDGRLDLIVADMSEHHALQEQVGHG